MFVYVCIILGALQSYTWSLTYTVTTSGGNPPDGGSQLSCMRSSAPVHPTSSAHRMQVYPYRDEHGWAHYKRYSRMVPIILILWANGFSLLFPSDTRAATTTAATRTSIIMPSRASIQACPMTQPSPPRCTIPLTTDLLHRLAVC